MILTIGLCAATPARAQGLDAPEESGDEAEEAPARTIDPDAGPAEDQAIAGRLREIFATLEGLGDVTVEVNAGVVSLQGETDTQEQKARALTIAGLVEGVVEVEDELTVTPELRRRLTPARERLQDAWQGFVRLLPVLLVSLAILAIFVAIARLVGRSSALWRQLAPNARLAALVSQAAQGALVIAGIFLALLLLDATGVVRTMLGAAGILGLALSFALRDTVENYISSILLSVRRPFGLEDYVRIDEHEGIVTRLTGRSTVLLTLDGNQIRIPNAAVFKGVIVNFTQHPVRRFTFELGVAPDADLARARALALEAMRAVPGVLRDPEPAGLYKRVAASTVDLMVTGWMDQRSHDFLRVRAEAVRLVFTRLRDEGIDLPEETLRVRRAKPAGTSSRPHELAGPTGSTEEAADTSRDRSLDEVLSRERVRGSGALTRDVPEE